MDNIKEFISRYFCAIIGVIVAIILLCTHLYKVIIGIILIYYSQPLYIISFSPILLASIQTFPVEKEM